MPALTREIFIQRARQQVARLRSLQETIDAAIEELVGNLRLTGASWEQIGSVLDMSKQGAAKKYGHLDEALEQFGVELADRADVEAAGGNRDADSS